MNTRYNLDEIFVYTKIDREDPNNLIKYLEQYEESEIKEEATYAKNITYLQNLNIE